MLKTLGEKIRALRDAAGLTQEMLAKKVGVSKNTVLNWEKNKREPRSSEIEALSNALGVEIGDLLVKAPSVTMIKVVASKGKLRFFQELPDGSLVPVHHPAHRCTLDEILAENPDLEVWFRTQKLSEEAKEEIVRLLLAIKNKWSAESASEAGDDLPALSLRAASSHVCDETDEEDEEDEDLHFRTR